MDSNLLLCMQPAAILDPLPSSSSSTVEEASLGMSTDTAGKDTMLLELVE